MAHVFVTTEVALDKINGDEVLAEVTRRLEARYVFLAIRSDPWFYGYSGDTAPYAYADLSNALTEEEYAASRTITCTTGSKCRLGPSLVPK